MMKQLKQGELFSTSGADLQWQPSSFAVGMLVKDIAVAGGFEMQLVSMEPGAHIPPHTHALPEFIYILEGELHVAGKSLTAGCMSIAAPGSEHLDVHSTTGCTFVLVDRPL
jgi:quercetin dioxygenase-like cupin family protein